jgi:hypothetical protein
MNILVRNLFSLLLAIGFSMNAYSQQQSLIGLNVNGDVSPNKFRPSVGLTFDKQFLKHSGLETGLFYRTSKLSGVVTYMDESGFYSNCSFTTIYNGSYAL